MSDSTLPSLAHLNHRLAEKRLIHRCTFGPASTAQLEHLGDGFTRRVDQAIVEYELAREAMAGGGLGSEVQAFYRAEYHLEACIGGLRRAIRFMGRLHAKKAQIGGQPIVRADHELLPNTATAERIILFRDALEHMDERVIREEVLPTDFTWAKVSRHGAMVHDGEVLREITYGELADWLSQLYDVAAQMSAFSFMIGAQPQSVGEAPKVSVGVHLADQGDATE